MKKNLLVIALILLSSGWLQAQVTQINSNRSLHLEIPLGNNKTILASTTDSSIWVTNGTLAGTVIISSVIKYAYEEGVINGKLLFAGRTDALGLELYITDGTAAGTVLLKDINPGAMGSDPGDASSLLNGYVYFFATTLAEGRELWRSNGTAAGTTLVKDIVPGAVGSSSDLNDEIFSNGTFLVFAANTPVSGNELWTSNGTAAGTVLLKEINPAAASSDPQSFQAFNNIAFFEATDAAHGTEIWRTDGTAAGTVLLKDINPGVPSGISLFTILYFYTFNGKAYFTADDGTHGNELWSTDGTEANTTFIKDIEPGALGSFDYTFNAITVGNKFFFPVTNFTFTKFQLWQSDGTPNGTSLFKDFPNDNDNLPFILNSFDYTSGTLNQPLFQGNKFFFVASTPAEGYELWISDGTLGNTHIVKDINTGTGDGIDFTNFSYSFTPATLYIAETNAANGNEIWRTDGSAAGTALVADINSGVASSNPELYPVIESKIFFAADNGDNANETDFYVLNGTFSPLPISQENFTVSPKGTDALLQWNTAREINSRDFTIQRSDDGISFAAVGNVPAAGSSVSAHLYTFSDPDILNSGKGIVYYRLMLTDKDGNTTLSKVVSLKLSNLWNIVLESNIVSSELKIIAKNITDRVKLRITDANGKVIYNSVINASGTVLIPVGKMQAGLYFLSAQSNGSSKLIRFVKE